MNNSTTPIEINSLDKVLNDAYSFKDKLREKILSSFSDLISPEIMNGLIDAEIKAFFETKDSLFIETEKVYIDRISKKAIEIVIPSNSYKYYNNYNIETKEFFVIKSNMTPFRQLVWSSLFEHIKPAVDKAIAENCNNVKDELNNYLSDKADSIIKEHVGVNFKALAMFQSEVMFAKFAKDSMNNVQNLLINNFNNLGLKYISDN